MQRAKAEDAHRKVMAQREVESKDLACPLKSSLQISKCISDGNCLLQMRLTRLHGLAAHLRSEQRRRLLTGK